MAKDLKVQLKGQDPLAIESVQKVFGGYCHSNPSIVAAFDMALYDILGKVAGLPAIRGILVQPFPEPVAMRFCFPALCLALTFALGCGGGGGGTPAQGTSSTPTPILEPGPTNLAISVDPATQEVTLAWTAPAETITGYDLEWAAGSSSYEQINDSVIPVASLGTTLNFKGIPPENTTWNFRVRGALGGAYTDYSNVVTYANGINPPRSLSVGWNEVVNQARILWTPNSLVADHAQVERAPFDPVSSAVNGPWTRVASLPMPQWLCKDGTLPAGRTSSSRLWTVRPPPMWIRCRRGASSAMS